MECKNCQKQLAPSDKFCGNCGAKKISHRLTLKHIISETANSFLNIDSNKPVRTFIDLFRCPEQVINGYIIGVRKRYIHAFGYFTIAVTFSGIFYFMILKFFPETLEFTANISNQEMTPEQLEMTKDFQRAAFEYQSFMTFASIPLLALFSWIVFFNKRKYNYAEHLVLNLYTFSQASIITISLYFLTFWNPTLFTAITILVIFIQIAYYCYVLKRVFNLTIGQLFIKLIFFLALFSVVISIIIVVFTVLLFLSGGMDEVIEAEKAKRGISYIASSVINWTS
ncbi:MAG TPA: DUF3667 domain-containing protein [Flavobacteriaceae bacterium]|nr:hypothetical protein [Flavobacteriaceae bacterium]HBR55523.1 hypothetical protein [Flavobacteriaceae bacterium]HIN97823.1 DUF3667 domain-containing protein [Flavobacteriaceae bacterium]